MAKKVEKIPAAVDLSASPEKDQVVIEKISEAEVVGAPEAQLAVNVYDLPTELVIVAPIAGVKREDLNLKINQDVLLIEGQRTFTVETDLPKEKILVKECFAGNFARTIVLPDNVNPLEVKAQFVNCVLTVRIPHIKSSQERVVRVEIE